MCLVPNYKVKGCIASPNDRYGSRNELVPVPIAEIVLLPQRFELLLYSREKRGAVRLEVDQKYERLFWVFVEHAVICCIAKLSFRVPENEKIS